jgi:undecaprenyl diphosphate synthase
MSFKSSPAPHIPTHVAFIMDGNGRWAQKKGWARLKGHAAGIDAVKRTIEHLGAIGVPYATFYAFSTENWKRSAEEVNGLFTLMRTFFKQNMQEIGEKGLRIKFIGHKGSPLAPDIVKLMEDIERETEHNTGLTAAFAINYSGRDELTRAMQNIATQAQSGTLAPGDISAETISGALDTHHMPDPDLVIRTSGEQRLSNFLLWQLAYAELYFCPIAWPDFGSTQLQAALSSFGARERRFGAVPAASAETQAA